MDRERLIRAQDWRRNAGKDWRDGILLANGKIGAVVSAPGHLEWVVNSAAVFDPTVANALLDKRLPHQEILRRIAKMEHRNTLFLSEAEDAPVSGKVIRDTVTPVVLLLRCWHGLGWSSPSMPQVNEHLSLYDGELVEEMVAHNFHPVVTSFTPRDTTLLCLRITENDAPDRDHILEVVRPQNDQLDAPKWSSEGNTLVMTQRLFRSRMSYAVAVRICPHASGSAVQEGRRTSVSGELVQSGDADVFVSVKSTVDAADPVAAALAEVEWAQKQGFEVLQTENRRWWREYWEKSYANFGKYSAIQKNFTFCLYSLACNFGGAPMPGLNGLAYGPLNGETPGVGYQGYTHDQNAQIPALALFPTGRTELVTALVDTYWNVRQTLRSETRKLFGCQGIYLPLTMNQQGFDYPSRSYRYTLNGSAYTAMVLAKAWRFSQDVTLLKNKLYPLLRELVIFYTEIMHQGEDGVYHLDWMVPPEIFTLTRDEVSAVSMLKVALETLVECARLLKRDSKYLPRWQDILDHYPPVCKTPEGAYWCGPDVPLDHYFFGGHLCYPFFPAGIDQSAESARQTLKLIEDHAVERSFADRAGLWHLNHEWSMFLTTSVRIRLGDRQDGWQWLNRFLELFAKENGLFSHDPILIGDPAESEENERNFQSKLGAVRKFCDGTPLTPDNQEVPHPICVTPNPEAKRLAPAVQEGNSSFLSMACETMLQSHGGLIRLFPCVPEDFTGSFSRFAAEGGFVVSAAMKNGRLVKAEITAAGQGGICRIQRPDGEGVYETILKANETITLKE